jgi:regulator of nonsense transcripts 2
LLGYPSKTVFDLARKANKPVEEVPIKVLVTAKNVNEMRMLVSETYEKLCEHLVNAHTDFRSKESRFEKDKLIFGTLSDAKQSEFDNAKKLFEKFLSVVTSLSEGIHQKMPVLVIEREEEECGQGLTVWDSSGLNPHNNDPDFISGGYYGDQETRSFYEDLPDLLNLVPLSVLGLTPEQVCTCPLHSFTGVV